MSGKIRVMSDENCLTKDAVVRREVDDTHWKKLCFTQFSTRMAASNLFHMFIQPIKFHVFHYHVLIVQMFEKRVLSNRQ